MKIQIDVPDEALEALKSELENQGVEVTVDELAKNQKVADFIISDMEIVYFEVNFEGGLGDCDLAEVLGYELDEDED